jgi:hypothetical protein
MSFERAVVIGTVAALVLGFLGRLAGISDASMNVVIDAVGGFMMGRYWEANE